MPINLELIIGWLFKPLEGWTLTDCAVFSIESILALIVVYIIVVIIRGALEALDNEK